MGEAKADTGDFTGKKPYALTILGDTFEVSSWRGILIKMTEIGLEFDIFEQMRERFPRTFTREHRDNSIILANGWWLYTPKSANAVMDFCEKVMDIIGIADDEWEVLYE
jgi:hypothetical protein